VGTVNLEETVCALQTCGYDGTITLEVFTPDKHHLTYSRDRLRAVWNQCSRQATVAASAR
jgi:sugar phosphate isomerase/epimerase